MARLPSRAGPGLVCYAARVQRLGAVLSNGAAPICPGRWHSVRPPHGTPGAAILTRTEAAQGPVEHAQERRKRKWWIVGWIWRSVQSPMAAERESDSTEPPSSETLLDAVLRNLYDLGETEVEKEHKRIRKKREKKRDVETIADVTAESLPLPGVLVRGQRKSASSFFKELKEELHSAPAVPSAPPSGPEVPAATAVSPSPLKNNSKLVEVVEFQSNSKKRKPKSDQEEHTKNKTRALEKDLGVQEFNLEKARLEVHRFGITGYGKGKERVLERERAIMLGAKPPKNSYVNYKVLQKQIKEKKAALEEEKRVARDTDIFKRKKRKGQEDRRSKKSAPSILSNGRVGQVGKFRNGTLILSPTDIKKINSSRVAK
ncbi:uncharacterized protein C1orf131 homolog isoform X1 [Peromyscus leucopus]|uniref:uncharacterized protein C1orf131 homolog isoform X1 n=1 Tax=Peromyscus leucopus TaxID=10041 RepID=UPI00188508EE|nr:uncharacterized protein C1orf131 homolog isoform X1 [Peromyscus leucopus]